MKTLFIALLLAPILIFGQSNSNTETKENLSNDVLWVTQSLEYSTLCRQIYSSASHMIFNKLKTNQSPVIIMDLDETVLDNSQYQIELFLKDREYDEKSWNNWVKKEVADLVPGSKEFILSFKKHENAKIIFLSNRSESTLSATKNNMKKLGIYFDDDIFLLRKNKNDTKIIRRKEVYEGINRMKKHGPQFVIAYFGDAMGDFPKSKNDKGFSINKFIFPNPMYGKWRN